VAACADANRADPRKVPQSTASLDPGIVSSSFLSSAAQPNFIRLPQAGRAANTESRRIDLNLLQSTMRHVSENARAKICALSACRIAARTIVGEVGWRTATGDGTSGNRRSTQ
jgi:hypothetical protein